MCEYCEKEKDLALNQLKQKEEQNEGVNWLKFWYNGYRNNGMTADQALRATIIDHANAEGFDPIILAKFLEEVNNGKNKV